MSSPSHTLSTYVQSIVIVSGSNTQSATLDDKDYLQAFTAQIDSTFPYLWLPDPVVDRFVEIFGLKYDQETDLYTINVTQRIKNLNNPPTISIKMAESASSPNATEINLPYSAFDLNASWPIYNTSTPYFPIRRSPTGTYVLGRTLLQESYLVVDYGRQTWSLGQARFPPTVPPQNIVPIQGATTTKQETKHTSLGPGVFAGIIVAAIVVAASILAAILFYRRKLKKQRLASTPPYDVTEVDPNKFLPAGLSATSPIRGHRGSMRSNESDLYSELPSSVGGGPLSPANVHPPEGFYALVGTRNRRVSELPSRERDVKAWLEGKSSHSRGPSDTSTELSGGDMPVVAELPAESVTSDLVISDLVSDEPPSPRPGALDDPSNPVGGERGRNGDNAARTTTRRPLTAVQEVDIDGEEGNDSETTPELPLAAVQDGEKDGEQENATTTRNQEH
jgi:hypothetical protein